MLDDLEFDTIYHEHLCYFSLTALTRLFDAHGLEVVDVEQIADPRRLAAPVRPPQAAPATRRRATAVTALLDEERAWGVLDPRAPTVISAVACSPCGRADCARCGT